MYTGKLARMHTSRGVDGQTDYPPTNRPTDVDRLTRQVQTGRQAEIEAERKN